MTEVEIAWTVSAVGKHTYEYTFPADMAISGTVATKGFCDGTASSCPISLRVYTTDNLHSG
jgi:hypothetical protein